MFSFTISLFLVLLVVNLNDGDKRYCKPDYYWRDYNGTIPDDAIIGGLDINGVPFYVGQAYFTNYELLVTTIFPGKKSVRARGGEDVLETNENIKILCSPSPQVFNWIPTKKEDLHLLTNTNRRIVIGGSEDGQILYVGRAFEGREIVIGKIFKHHWIENGLWLPYKGQYANYKSYDILVYDCSIF